MAFALSFTGLTQEEAIYMQVDYMKVLPGAEEDYVWMENAIYKPIHTQRIANGEIVAWYLYQVQYPRGSDSEYDYVTITAYANFSLMDESSVPYETLIKSVHPDKSIDEINGYATNTRKLVRSEVLKSIDRFPGELENPSRSMLIDLMKASPLKEPVYTRMEKEIWRPLHMERKQRGLLESWGFYELVFPGGLEHPYSHATATGFRNWEQIKDSWPEDIWAEVHPNATQEELELRAHETRDLVSTQIWKLVDFTIARTNPTND